MYLTECEQLHYFSKMPDWMMYSMWVPLFPHRQSHLILFPWPTVCEQHCSFCFLGSLLSHPMTNSIQMWVTLHLFFFPDCLITSHYMPNMSTGCEWHHFLSFRSLNQDPLTAESEWEYIFAIAGHFSACDNRVWVGLQVFFTGSLTLLIPWLTVCEKHTFFARASLRSHIMTNR